ncbi:extracellular solute-binding protein [Oleidesulfovibrio sp.]|uniref:extracellular solute-binding protein n=1 Tax=Oleidesulfovibrio sp. TaxID=2909707 RepID=UPI003A8438AA
MRNASEKQSGLIFKSAENTVSGGKQCLQDRYKRVRQAIGALCLGVVPVLFLAAVLCFGSASGVRAAQKNVMTMGDAPQFAWNGKHFPHANPDAPKGGTLSLAARGNFDSMHAYIARGLPAAGIGFTVDTLGVGAPDHTIFEYYGLIAESFEVSDDLSHVTFHINPAARFHDGMPITAEDVAYTFRLLMEYGAPRYKQYYASVQGVEVLSARSVRFTLTEKNNAELPVILAQLPVLPKHYWEKHDFSKPSLTPAVGSGPYKVKDFSLGSYVEYELVTDYWAKDLPVNKGRYNFGTIRYEYFRDETVAREAFKAGEFDFYSEGTAKAWVSAYTGPAVKAGHIKREELTTNRPMGMYGFIFNTRKDFFADRRVRQAISLLFDFEWTNKAIFHNAYTRSTSYFSNSELASSGVPSESELAVLRPFADQLAPEVLTEPYHVPVTKGDGNVREQMRQALSLLQQAGWQLKDGTLQNAAGQRFEFSILLRSASLNRVVLPFRRNLGRIGINMHVSLVDPTQYVNRIRSFDYDMIMGRVPQSSSPGNEQRSYWTSSAADTTGSGNYAGVRSAVVDALVEHIIASADREELVTNCRALDRVLLHGAYFIPGWYSSVIRIAYWDKFRRSDLQPATGFDMHSWWVDEEAEKALRATATGYGK